MQTVLIKLDGRLSLEMAAFATASSKPLAGTAVTNTGKTETALPLFLNLSLVVICAQNQLKKSKY